MFLIMKYSADTARVLKLWNVHWVQGRELPRRVFSCGKNDLQRALLTFQHGYQLVGMHNSTRVEERRKDSTLPAIKSKARIVAGRGEEGVPPMWPRIWGTTGYERQGAEEVRQGQSKLGAKNKWKQEPNRGIYRTFAVGLLQWAIRGKALYSHRRGVVWPKTCVSWALSKVYWNTGILAYKK